MDITSVDAISLNGKYTAGQDADAHTWTSDEDWQHFTRLRDSYDLIVMGSGTYDVVRPEPEEGRLRVVLTSRPKDYADKTIPGQLEFMNLSPEELVPAMKKRGHRRMLLVGGRLNTAFLSAGLVTDMYVTIEPFVFGSGRNWHENQGEWRLQLRLDSVARLNDRGTILLHYHVEGVDNGGKLQ